LLALWRLQPEAADYPPEGPTLVRIPVPVPVPVLPVLCPRAFRTSTAPAPICSWASVASSSSSASRAHSKLGENKSRCFPRGTACAASMRSLTRRTASDGSTPSGHVLSPDETQTAIHSRGRGSSSSDLRSELAAASPSEPERACFLPAGPSARSTGPSARSAGPSVRSAGPSARLAGHPVHPSSLRTRSLRCFKYCSVGKALRWCPFKACFLLCRNTLLYCLSAS